MNQWTAAVAQFPVERPGSWHDAASQIEDWVAQAVTDGASLLVFPEYASMALTAMLPAAAQSSLELQLRALQALRDDYLDLHCQLARTHGVYILAGSFPWQTAQECFVNRAFLCSPEGTAGYQDKQVMTRFERDDWLIIPGESLTVFDTGLGKLGIAICYDSEFPMLVRAQVEAGAEVVLVPSCTDTLAGYHRVRVAARARALEGQCYTLLSPLVGSAPWSLAVDINKGAAGVFCPPDRGFPESGIVAEGRLDRPGWTYAELDLERVREVRRSGQVLNVLHWPESVAGTMPPKLQKL